MRQYNSLTFEVEDIRGESIIVAKETYTGDLASVYAIAVVNKNTELELVIKASKNTLIELGKGLKFLEDDKEE